MVKNRQNFCTYPETSVIALNIEALNGEMFKLLQQAFHEFFRGQPLRN